MIKKIEGKNLTSQVNILEMNGKTFSSPEQISNGLGEQFSYNSSSENYAREFQQYKEHLLRRITVTLSIFNFSS